MPQRFHLAIIGGGPAGYVAGIRGAQLGAEVCVIEQDRLGGTCLNRGCIPTKSLIASLELARAVRNGAAFGLEVKGVVRPSFPGLMRRKEKIVEGLHKGIGALFKSHGVTRIRGRARFLGPGRLAVEEASGEEADLEADKWIIATGSRPAQIPAFPIDGERILSTDDALALRELPKSILIVGAGVSGCEFAFIFRELGCEVAMVELLPRALPLEDEDISRTLERELKKSKIRLFAGRKIEKVEQASDGLMAAHLEDGTELKAEKVLVTIGRAFNTEGLGLERVGVELSPRGEVRVNDRMETSAPGTYAAGDVVGGLLLAHVASSEGIVAVTNALGGHARMDYTAVPAGIFTMPEIGRVGLTEAEARERYREVEVGRFSFRGLGKAHVLGETTGEVKIVASGRGELLGVHIIGPRAADLVHEASLAMRWGISAEKLAEAIHAHPTLAEATMEAAHALRGRSVHSLRAS